MKNRQFNMRIADEYLVWLDELRRKEQDIPDRSEMARRCIEIVARQRGVAEHERPKRKQAL